ncbi:MAG: hypothetical protein P8Y67_13950, partial [Alphaproteobacteria bacterium]
MLSLLALEPRMVFDGAMVPHSIDTIMHPELQDVSSVADTHTAPPHTTDRRDTDWQALSPVAAAT